jgi:hypothetical protein
MKNQLLYLFLFITSISFSQKNFLKGYYIDTTGKKVECFIKNLDWSYNPENFEIKNSLETESKSISITDAKEFSIDGVSKYVRANVEIDNSKGDPDYSIAKEPNFVSLIVFLKVLVEGKNSLYRYENDLFPRRYFFKTENKEIKQLVYKKYFESIENLTDLYVNDSFKKQLLTSVNCNNNKKVESLRYLDDDLIDYFNSVNNCQGDTSSKEISKRDKSKLFYKLALNTNFSNLSLKYKNGLNTIPFDGKNETEKKTSFTIGVEIEIELPFNNKSWSIFTEPSYTSYSGSGVMTSTYYINPNYSTGLVNDDYTINLKYNSINFPLGIKRNFIFNKLSKLYINTALTIQIANNSNITILRKNNTVLMNSSLNGTHYDFFFGIGYQYKKVIAELRQYTNTNLNPYINTDKYSFKNTSIILKYQFN